ncbi:restriction endonuclease subunit S [Pseudanabaena yagii]|uniref:Type I restriction modification DNA specificity domain-containing protein n=1 Tax=Pseudanabaena yagii GIHE-NHR1 TaxID=2722753 RepID=A0ABX1LY10_9CYAN|nr:restriction endonuclease subunit S [Pseudanabaena yagii]NMF61088.1 hypothetical protein [Pseudanabaena yagii GIHE-NHR1]
MQRQQFYIQAGDFVISKRQIVHGACGFVPKELEGSIVSNEYLVLNFTDKIIPQFWDFLTHTIYFQQVCFHSSIGVHVEKMLFNVSRWYQWKVNIPTLKEQEKIASFLGAVDTRLAQLRRKHELLQTYKRGVMQEIFSQQIRFKGDDGKPFPNWEEKKLGEVATFSKGKGISKENLDNTGKLKCIRYAELYTMYGEIINYVFSRTNLEPDDLILSKVNDVIIPSSGETAIDIAKAACVCVEGVILGGDINILRSKMDGRFLAHYLNHYKKYEIASAAQGNTVVHLYSSHLKNIEIEVPDEKEQGKIADFLIAIDQKIEAVAKQINLTEQFKKGLLQKMFV